MQEPWVHLESPSTLSHYIYNLPSLAPPNATDLHDELNQYLSTDPEAIEEVLMWWYMWWGLYPWLFDMVLDYLSIPGVLFCL